MFLAVCIFDCGSFHFKVWAEKTTGSRNVFSWFSWKFDVHAPAAAPISTSLFRRVVSVWMCDGIVFHSHRHGCGAIIYVWCACIAHVSYFSDPTVATGYSQAIWYSFSAMLTPTVPMGTMGSLWSGCQLLLKLSSQSRYKFDCLLF